ncbi:peptidylprolyl isomerase [Pedobacter yulinensis]|uniref:Peptidyl-prolyl cis-trans isomerase n=1 Tax=Pedobacter yulinensis TaxID=2126353 RepID=A0A2T3HPJ0_9SPHI|nr:FKBP-type peptidyl-prolyl cis-trans isomerase [Pedobacter yulinensis]PST84364.1 peptidylprolyl isomerase [Pedobacter yulinensis]
MLKTRVLAVLLAGIFFVSCAKKETFDADAQARADEQIIKDFIAKNNIPAVRDPSSGVYYQIVTPGTGNVTYSNNPELFANYTGRLLDGTVFQKSTEPIKFRYSGVILGWQVGLAKIQPGGRIRLIIPSGYAYGSSGYGNIPPNTVLDFDVDLIKAQ